MKIKALSLAFAGATTVGLAYTALSLALSFFPAQTLKLIATIMMMPKFTLIKPFIKVTGQSIATGIISHAVMTFLFLWLIATLYNLFQRPKIN